VNHPIFYRTARVDGLSIFYRETGPKDAPALLLLHGFPSSSRMFESLFPRLSDHFHLVAPDYPGFGHSDWPDPKRFDYSFDHIASVIEDFTQAIGLSHYTLYLQDYGGPIGFRMTLEHPERVKGLIIQNAVAHDQGLGAIWQRVVHSGRTGFHTKKRSVRISSRLQLRNHDILGVIRKLSCTTLTFGPMNTLF